MAILQNFIRKINCIIKERKYMTIRNSERHQNDVTKIVTSLGQGYYSINNAIYRHKGYYNEFDNIVLSKYGIFVIEAKYCDGKVIGKKMDDFWEFIYETNKEERQNPLRQNYGHIILLSKKFNIDKSKFHNVVVFSDNTDLGEINETNVIKLSDLKEYILNHNEELIKEETVKKYKEKMSLQRGKNYENKKRLMLMNIAEDKNYFDDRINRLDQMERNKINT